MQARFRALNAPCALCGNPIDYALPYLHPLSFVIDEDKPVSRWREFGYESPAAAAADPDNCQPAHRACNRQKAAMTTAEYFRWLAGQGPKNEVAEGW